MNTQELEETLEGGTETQRIEFKGACDWSVRSLAKDILALSNVRDGGYIIVGIEDENFNRQGITVEQKQTYNIDTMRDQMASYADPHVNFVVSFPNDRFGKKYAAIRVLEFEEIPVICRRDSQDTKAGIVYYRNRNRRPESAPVSNSYDMRDIIELATVKRMRKTRELGLTVSPSVKEILDEELQGL